MIANWARDLLISDSLYTYTVQFTHYSFVCMGLGPGSDEWLCSSIHRRTQITRFYIPFPNIWNNSFSVWQ